MLIIAFLPWPAGPGPDYGPYARIGAGKKKIAHRCDNVIHTCRRTWNFFSEFNFIEEPIPLCSMTVCKRGSSN